MSLRNDYSICLTTYVVNKSNLGHAVEKGPSREFYCCCGVQEIDANTAVCVRATTTSTLPTLRFVQIRADSGLRREGGVSHTQSSDLSE